MSASEAVLNALALSLAAVFAIAASLVAVSLLVFASVSAEAADLKLVLSNSSATFNLFSALVKFSAAAFVGGLNLAESTSFRAFMTASEADLAAFVCWSENSLAAVAANLDDSALVLAVCSTMLACLKASAVLPAAISAELKATSC